MSTIIPQPGSLAVGRADQSIGTVFALLALLALPHFNDVTRILDGILRNNIAFQ